MKSFVRMKTMIQPGNRASLLICVAVASAIASFSVAGCRWSQALTEQETEGKRLYTVRCAHCHEDNDLQLKKAPPDLHNLFAHPALPSGTPLSDGEIRRVVLQGKGMMPAFAGRFTEPQMSALLAYLRTGLR